MANFSYWGGMKDSFLFALADLIFVVLSFNLSNFSYFFLND